MSGILSDRGLIDSSAGEGGAQWMSGALSDRSLIDRQETEVVKDRRWIFGSPGGDLRGTGLPAHNKKFSYAVLHNLTTEDISISPFALQTPGSCSLFSCLTC